VKEPSTTSSTVSQEKRNEDDSVISRCAGKLADILTILTIFIAISATIGFFYMGSPTWGLVEIYKENPDFLLKWKEQITINAKKAKVSWNGPKEFTAEELSKYDGSDPDLPIYLAVKGKVYDVSSAAHMYGKDKGYNGFAGRDASRAFLDLCFSVECLEVADDLNGLTEEQMKGIDDWAGFYTKEEKYPYVGTVKKKLRYFGPKLPPKDFKE